MIYRPLPIIEIKAQTIENIIRREIIQARNAERTLEFLAEQDLGFELGQGRRAAIKRRITFLEQQALLAKQTHNKVSDLREKDEIDVIEDF